MASEFIALASASKEAECYVIYYMKYLYGQNRLHQYLSIVIVKQLFQELIVMCIMESLDILVLDIVMLEI